MQRERQEQENAHGTYNDYGITRGDEMDEFFQWYLTP
jgi:hypothetical protein